MQCNAMQYNAMQCNAMQYAIQCNARSFVCTGLSIPLLWVSIGAPWLKELLRKRKEKETEMLII